ncbi:MAG TPA: hypothetical protein VFG83_18665, partial [Kofleriaceae bacterium]|nr:hypothetical protein [Kofleriaceae bacterium]
MSFEAWVEALRAPLFSASREQFAGAAVGVEVGEPLRAALDRVLAAAPDGTCEELSRWRKRLAGFEEMTDGERAVELARGLRLCQAEFGGGAARAGAGVRARAG